MQPGLLGIGLLFAGSFLVALLILTRGDNPSGVAAQSGTVITLPDIRVANAAEARATTVEPSIAAAPDDPANDIPDLAAARMDATRAGDPNDRILAIQVLADDSSRESFDTLLTAMRAANDPRERATAIASLRGHPRNVDNESRMRNAMQAATYDSDPLVVVMAQSALQELDQPQ